MAKKVFVSGCFDLLHSGHVAFFEEACKYGDLYVALGSDRNVFALKNRPTINQDAERLYMVKSLAYVKEAFINQGSGVLDFIEGLRMIKPDYFVVNVDGHTPEKQALCKQFGIEYVVLKRDPHPGLTARSTTSLRSFSTIPFGLCLAGNLFDLPQISGLQQGSALTVSLHATTEFNKGTEGTCGLRASAEEIWGTRLPFDRPEKLSKMLFGFHNLPGRQDIHGASESIGIIFPGLTKADYDGEYWPRQIQFAQDELVLNFLENVIQLMPMNGHKIEERKAEGLRIEHEHIRTLANAVKSCWQALISKNVSDFGTSLQEAAFAQDAVRPGWLDIRTYEVAGTYQQKIHGWTTAAVGANQYLVLVADQPIENSTRINIRRKSD